MDAGFSRDPDKMSREAFFNLGEDNRINKDYPIKNLAAERIGFKAQAPEPGLVTVSGSSATSQSEGSRCRECRTGWGKRLLR